MMAVAAVLAVLAGIAPAGAAVATVEFVDTVHTAALGTAFAEPIAVTVRDGNGPVEGVEVMFSVQPDSTGATAELAASSAVTDADGVARVSVTAGHAPGFPRLSAQAQGLTAQAQLVNRPPGYLPGEQLATIEGLNQDGETETVGATKGKKPFLIVDVCASWCGPCRFFAEQAEAAIAQLALVGVEVELVSLIAEGEEPGSVSTQTDALLWKQRNGLTGPVLHADGSHQSSLYRSAFFTLYGEGDIAAFPTHLLVDPKGTILDRRVSSETTEQTVERVLQHAKAKKPKRTPVPDAGEVGVTLPDGGSFAHRFPDFGLETFDWGVMGLEGADSAGAVSRSWTYGPADPSVLISDGSVELSLTRFRSETSQRLVTPSVRVDSIMALWDGTDIQAVLQASTTRSASQQGGTVSVVLDLPTLRDSLRAELEAGRYQVTFGSVDGPLTADQIEALVSVVYSVGVTAEYWAR